MAGATVTEQRFEVKRSDADTGRRVIVQFEHAVAAAAAQQARRTLDDDQPFWLKQAAAALAHYIWSHADVPPEGRLVVDTASGDLLQAARRAAR